MNRKTRGCLGIEPNARYPETPLSSLGEGDYVHLLSRRLTILENWGKCIYFLLNEQPSVNRALPPVGWQSTVEHPAQMTTVWACEKTVVIVKHPGHLTSMKNDLGDGTRVWMMILVNFGFVVNGCEKRTLSLCLRASA